MPTTSPVIASLLGAAAVLAGCMLAGCSEARVTSETGLAVPPGYVPVTIGFEARVGSEPFDCGAAYQLGTPPSEARPSLLRLFVSDVSLLDADGNAAQLLLDANAWQENAGEHNVALLDFEDGSDNCRFGDEDTRTSVSGWVPPDFVASGLSFRIGVPDALNHDDAGLAPPPRNRPGMWLSQRDGHVALRLELDTVNADSHREPTVDDRTAPGGWQLWLAQTVVAAPYPRGVDPAASSDEPCAGGCPRELQPLIELATFDVESDTVVLDVAELLSDVDFARSEFDPLPEAPPQPTDATITDYPMPDYAPGFFMERVDGEGAVVLDKLGIDWLSLAPPDPAPQVFARRGE